MKVLLSMLLVMHSICNLENVSGQVVQWKEFVSYKSENDNLFEQKFLQPSTNLDNEETEEEEEIEVDADGDGEIDDNGKNYNPWP